MNFWENKNLVATTLFGLEPVLANELKQLGAADVEIGKRSVYFIGDMQMMYKANLWCRTAIRILKPVYQGQAADENTLFRKAELLPWHQIINPKQTFKVQASVNSKYFSHSQYVALKLKDAIVDQCRSHYGSRPSIDLKNPDIVFNLHIQDMAMTISLDSSGQSLHKRGYKLFNHEASLSEVLAAGMLGLCEWDKQTPLLDPMCGSGTILTEAALMASNTAPGLYRDGFAFQNWQDFDADLWQQLKVDARKAIKQDIIPILGIDRQKQSVYQTTENIENAGMEDWVKVRAANFFRSTKKHDKGIIVVNPPYDERLKLEDTKTFYKEIGDTLKQKYAGWQAWILSSNKAAIKSIGLRTSKRLALMNGPLECSFYCYDMFEGKRIDNKDNQ